MNNLNCFVLFLLGDATFFVTEWHRRRFFVSILEKKHFFPLKAERKQDGK